MKNSGPCISSSRQYYYLLTATNLLLLPSLLLSFNRSIATKAFEEPLLVILDEDEDIDLEGLEVKKEEPVNNLP